MKHLYSALGPLVLSLFCLMPAVSGMAQNSTPAAAAAVPHLVNFNGTAPEAQPGETVTLKFALYETQTGGDAIWSETQQVTPDSKGRYAVLLGGATQGGLPQTAFNAAQARWLGVTVGESAEQPRTILVATPYSLKASDAETLAGHPLSDFKLADSATGKPDTATDITTVDAGTGITVTGNGTSTVTVGINTTYLESLAANFAVTNAANTFKASQTIDGGLTVTGNITIDGTINSSYLNSLAAQVPTLKGNNTMSGTNTFTKPVTFAADQPFPNTVSSIIAGTGITATENTGVVTVSVNPAALESTYNGIYAQLVTANTFNATQTISNGNLVLSSGVVNLPASASPYVGNLQIGGVPYLSAAGGPSNVFAGPGAGNYSTTGNLLAGFGEAVLLANTTGSDNTAVGADALTATTTGSDDTAAGVLAGYYNKTGSNNTYLGASAGPDSASTALTNSTAIGANATVSESNALVLGGTGSNAVSVGIGTATPQYTLDVHGSGNFTGAVNFAGSQTFTGNQTITGTETVSASGSGPAVYASSPGDYGIEGVATSTSSSAASYGVYGTAASYQGVGVYGKSTGDPGYGTAGIAPATGGEGAYGIGQIGVYGTSYYTGTTANPIGVKGYISSTYAGSAANPAIGVYGEADAAAADGVWGYSPGSSGFGVYGSSSGVDGTGVYGLADPATGTGVVGKGSFGIYGSSDYTGTTFSPTGVEGFVSATYTGSSSAPPVGVYGEADSVYGEGVSGVGPNGVGVYANGYAGMHTFGTEVGFASYGGSIGSYSYAEPGQQSSNAMGSVGFIAPVNSAALVTQDYDGDFSATYLNYPLSAGVAGDMQNGYGSGSGVLATADSLSALWAENAGTAATVIAQDDNSSATALTFQTNAPNYDSGAKHCSINNEANLSCSGTVSSVVGLAGSQAVAMYAVQSTENWFEDFGSGTVRNGSGHVALDPQFAATVNTGVKYHVFLTPEGESKGLYVTSKTAGGFDVREIGGGQSSLAFDYRIVAKRKGYEQVRMEDLSAMVHAQQAQAEARLEAQAKAKAERKQLRVPAHVTSTRHRPESLPAAAPPAERIPAPPAPKPRLIDRAANEVPQR